jgi:hypothetical protein
MAPFLLNPYISFPVAGGCSGSLISLSGLSGYYKMDDDSTDSSGNGYDMVNSGVTFTTTGAKFDSAAIFLTGSTDPTSTIRRLINMDDVLIAKTDSDTTTGFSITGWLKLDNLPTTSETYVFWINSELDRFMQLKYVQSAGAWRFVIYNGTSYTYDWVTTPATDTWIHFAFTMSPTTGEFVVYFDGTSRISGTNTNNTYVLSKRISIGNHPTATRTWLGWMDDVSIWERELSSSEVTTLYTTDCPLDTP